jgi:hypothetical protein
MQLDELRIGRAKLEGLCRGYGVRELLVFGSAAWGEMRPDSDVDVLVEFLAGADTELADHAALMSGLSESMGRKVDLISKNVLKSRVRTEISDEACLLYAA